MADRSSPDYSSSASQSLDVIGFDADDTLWHEISTYMVAKDAFVSLLERYNSRSEIDRRLDVTEMRNLGIFGYGAKGFIISMIETAIEITGERISAPEIAAIIAFGKSILHSPVTPLPDVERTIAELSSCHRLIVITKGDLFDQETKMARSGLGDYFSGLHVVSEKDIATYARIMQGYTSDPTRFMMVGNSLKSDILPVIALGGWAVHIPYEITWFMEHVETSRERPARQFVTNSIRDIPEIIRSIG